MFYRGKKLNNLHFILNFFLPSLPKSLIFFLLISLDGSVSKKKSYLNQKNFYDVTCYIKLVNENRKIFTLNA